MLCIYSSVLIAWCSWKRVNPFWKVKFTKYKFTNNALNNNCRSCFPLSFQNTMWQISYSVLHLFLCMQWRKDFSAHLYLKLSLNIFTLGLSCFERGKINAFTRVYAGEGRAEVEMPSVNAGNGTSPCQSQGPGLGACPCCVGDEAVWMLPYPSPR